MSKKRVKSITSVRLGDPDSVQIPAPFPLPAEILLAAKHLLTPDEIRQAVERGRRAAESRKPKAPLPPQFIHKDEDKKEDKGQ